MPSSTNFDFKTEIDWLPFQLNIGKEANLTWDQQNHFINLVYDNKEVFSLHDEDFRQLWPDKTYNTNYDRQACLLATLYYTQATTGWGYANV